MRNGYTTGTTACAAACAACLYKISGQIPENVRIKLPDGSFAVVPVFIDSVGVYAVKDAGDDIDVTDKMKIYADVALGGQGITIKGGKGIGTVTKHGLQIPVGEAAINPVPRKMITESLSAILKGGGATVTVSAPDGERIAKETFNEKVGVVGGISIIGTTGIVTPMSVAAIIDTIKCELNVAKAENIKEICLTPGKIGEKNFINEYPDIPVIMMSNYVGEACVYAVEKGFSKIYVAGHPSKLFKILMGYYDTHSKRSPMAVGWLADKLNIETVPNTVEEILEIGLYDLSPMAAELAEKIEKDFGFERVSVILYDMKGNKHGERL